MLQKQINKSRLFNKVLAIIAVLKNNQVILDEILLLLSSFGNGLSRDTLK